ncbi:MAG: metal-dependent transcriptional regulator [Candidatus Handelsmanbacteria bacterium]|nr:metal-dependent transcriptional regulator [Candidatus Handelsmanbacteria bacterium]
MLSEAVQDYLKAIYKLAQAEAGSVTTSLIAARLEVAPASVTNMVKKLAELRLLKHTPYQGVELTPAGVKIALEIIRHHRLLELYLAETLGYAWDQVHAEADRLEHAISEDFEDRIDQALGYPRVGAHGEPIPSKQGDIDTPSYQPLAQMQAGQQVVVRRVSDRYPEMLRYLDEVGLKLGVRLEVREKAPFQGPLVLRIGGCRKRLTLGLEVASQVFVEAV